jgi:hypothetical protein
MGIKQPLPTGPRRPKPLPGTTTPIKNDGGKKYIPRNPNPGGKKPDPARQNRPIKDMPVGTIDYLRNSIDDRSRQDRLYKTY